MQATEPLSVADEHRLPTLDVEDVRGFYHARRAVALTLLTVLALGAGAVVLVSTVEMKVTISSGGVIEPHRVWPVRSLSAGVVWAVLVNAGDTVTRGQVVAQLDTAASTDELRRLRLEYRAAQADFARAAGGAPFTINMQAEKVADAEAKLLHAKAALRDAIVHVSLRANTDSVLRSYAPGTSVSIDLALSDVQAADANLRSVRAALALARLDSAALVKQALEMQKVRGDIIHLVQQQERLRVVAPTDGIVLTDQVERLVATHVESGSQLMEIADVRQWRAVLAVRERDVHDVVLGQAGTIEMPAFKPLDGRQLRGRIVSVASQPTVSPELAMLGGSAAVYRVVMQLDDAEIMRLGSDAFRVGYNVRVRIVTRTGTIAALAMTYFRKQVSAFRN